MLVGGHRTPCMSPATCSAEQAPECVGEEGRVCTGATDRSHRLCLLVYIRRRGRGGRAEAEPHNTAPCRHPLGLPGSCPRCSGPPWRV